METDVQTQEGAASYLSSAKRVFEIESEAIAGLAAQLDRDFPEAVAHILATTGRVVVCGMGKSGLIGKKIVATMASTGTPSFFMHPAEAYHGDLGMVRREDVFIAISFSGETDEVVKLLPFLRDNGNILVAITGNPESTLAKASDCHLNVAVKQEACPLKLAPSSSTTATLAMGDALAIALMEARGFQPENFARFHPGGSLGRRLLSRVDDEMVTEHLPVVAPGEGIFAVLQSMTAGKLGLAIVQLEQGVGIITDGDLRRAFERHGQDIFRLNAADIMTSSPAAVATGTRSEDAFLMMERLGISALLVFDGDKLAGIYKK